MPNPNTTTPPGRKTTFLLFLATHFFIAVSVGHVIVSLVTGITPPFGGPFIAATAAAALLLAVATIRRLIR